ncbi:hypothetical protein C2G38_2051711 [Gigaspora rosea]|uniref:Uncharacterized protein n=1 Tax=Gigaspora rosea TaxID=44941 RepID=A0A397TQA7_9GLOM|nr:hypothetical protein C2G38_2051711 [Gigaspora rosea]
MLNKIETVTEKDQVVKLAVKLIWSATNRNVSSITFKGESSEFFCQDRSIIVDLGETDVVIIKGETYRKLTEKLFDVSKNSMELDFSENETTNLVEDNNEEVGEIIPNVQDLQPFVIINDPIPVTSIINRVPAIYVNKGKHKVEQTNKKGKKLKSYEEFTNNSESEKSGDSGSEFDILSPSHRSQQSINNEIENAPLYNLDNVLLHEQILANESNREIINDNGPENQLNDSPLYASNITDQETNIESSFEMPEKDSTNGIEKAEFSQIDDGRDELDNTLSTQQSSSIKENADILLLYNIPSSDEITQVNEIQGTKSNDQVVTS